MPVGICRARRSGGRVQNMQTRTDTAMGMGMAYLYEQTFCGAVSIPRCGAACVRCYVLVQLRVRGCVAARQCGGYHTQARRAVVGVGLCVKMTHASATYKVFVIRHGSRGGPVQGIPGVNALSHTSHRSAWAARHTTAILL